MYDDYSRNFLILNLFSKNRLVFQILNKVKADSALCKYQTLLNISLKVSNIIYVYQQTDDKNGEGGSFLSPSYLDVIDLKKKNLNSSEYLVHIIRELQDIENKWAKLLKNSDAEIQRAKKQKIGIEDDVAYTRCVALLDEEYETQEEKISKTRRKMKVAVQSAQEHIQLCQNQKRQRAEEIQKLRVEIEELENEETNFGKKVKRKYEIRQKIDEYKKEIEASSVRLQAAKQKSYEQRNLYVETQQVQLKLEGSLNKIEGDEKAYYQVRNRQEKYRKLSRMIQKLNSKTQGGNYDVQSYLKEKISAIAHLSSTLMSLQEKHKQYNTSIEEQVFVIEGMQRRLNQNIEIDDDVVKTYQDKYQKLYLSKNNGINSWKNYKSYLQEVLKRDQIQPTLNYQTQKRNPRGTFSHYEPQTTFSLRRNQSSLTKSPQTNSHFVRKYSNLRTQPHLSQIQEQQEDARSHNLTYQQSPIHRFNGYLPNEISADIVRLPKLGRSNVKTSLQTGKIKDNTRKLANQSFVSVVSENSEDEMSGSFVDINYNRK